MVAVKTECLFTGDSETKLDLKTVKIMTYNVWFRRYIELSIRMNAIGDLIQHHTPDLICFQVQIFSI
jgi:tyrosyl-DNA phosphodiesterase 2